VIPLAEQRLMAERANSQITEISGTPLDALLHPMDEPYGGIADKADRWIFVHFAQLVLTPFLAAGVWMLLEGIESIPALVARAFSCSMDGVLQRSQCGRRNRNGCAYASCEQPRGRGSGRCGRGD
jgi:hypothetical protein